MPRRRRRGPAPRGGRIEGLDGLRAIAIVGVLLFHFHPAALPGGFLGVDVFFVVSGFLITTLLLRELHTEGRLDLPRFWLRRARRLLPALVTVVVVSVSAALIVGGDLLVDIGRQTVGALTFSNNWLEIGADASYFHSTSPLLFVNFWSLAVEEQFYLLWPVLLVVVVALTRTTRQRVVVAGAAAAASALLMALLFTPGQDATRVYYGTDTHLFGLMVGAGLAFAWAGERRAGLRTAQWRRWRTPAVAASLAVLVILMRFLDEDTSFTFRGGILLACLATGVLIAGLLESPGPWRALMATGPLQWVGQRSYGIYLWHWPVLLVLTEAFPTAPGTSRHWWALGGALVLTLALTEVSYRLIETPVRRHGFRKAFTRCFSLLTVPWQETRTPRIVGGVVAALVLTTGVAIATAPDESRTEQLIEAKEAQLDEPGTEQDGGGEGPIEQPAADFSVPEGEEITAFGDSLVVTSADGLEHRYPGIMFEAKSNRQWPDAMPALERRLAEGTVRRAVIVHFGTNAGVDEELARAFLDRLGPDRMVVVMNLYGRSTFVPESNRALARVVEDHPNAIIGDWNAAVSAEPHKLQSDQVHPDMEGMHLYADVVAQAFAELAARHGH